MWISKDQLKRLAYERLKDARALVRTGRYSGAVYICGYSIELGIKAVICKGLRIREGHIPNSHLEIDALKGIFIHNLDKLAQQAGSLVTTKRGFKLDHALKKKYLGEWSALQKWDPEMRYDPDRKTRKRDAEDVLRSAGKVLRFLCRQL